MKPLVIRYLGEHWLPSRRILQNTPTGLRYSGVPMNKRLDLTRNTMASSTQTMHTTLEAHAPKKPEEYQQIASHSFEGLASSDLSFVQVLMKGIPKKISWILEDRGGGSTSEISSSRKSVSSSRKKFFVMPGLGSACTGRMPSFKCTPIAPTEPSSQNHSGLSQSGTAHFLSESQVSDLKTWLVLFIRRAVGRIEENGNGAVGKVKVYMMIGTFRPLAAKQGGAAQDEVPVSGLGGPLGCLGDGMKRQIPVNSS
ncbi:hypothetical protein CROQUDRAFT_106881 [Cronartium quercuum f. sp. fusiforme G11]|uniref:Uncharacterized protein n=1 Tax=Cronartium quercuum f. sp. fusiforme G11 TaxID=708437 RepID=A0A9P6NJ08_9BASI|nr:hypothetical protein CROQUDRAFT_106881 [Cronartium quercuum f. sp. fusiforme G11]